MRLKTILSAYCIAAVIVVDSPAAAVAGDSSIPTLAASHPSFSGIYPHLAFFNDEDECGTGAVVPWADRLWAITYAPHKPTGSSDKLYEIDAGLHVTLRPESMGGTHASRMVHPESRQLFIGPYVIDAKRNVRAISPSVMFGRLTGNARHLADPANRIYCATMEEGLYEIDVTSLAVTRLFADEQIATGTHAALPGYHGKGLYSGQGRLVYGNNGEHGKEAQTRPDIPSGCLAEWDGSGTSWTLVRRNQFTEVTGPGGIEGNADSAEPVWSVGWDHRSLILMLLDGGHWHAFRLPKASHCYDGAHGWNTEWPRIRDVGERDLLMTMHGMFWRFPRTFRQGATAGIAPRSTYLKVVGDFCSWQGRIVFGCDDTARNQFLNTRRMRGALASPGQSQSNLWFVEPQGLEHFGPALGTGGVWLNEPVKAGEPSEPFLFGGFERRALHLAHDTDTTVTFTLETDVRGDGRWSELRRVDVASNSYAWIGFAPQDRGEWVRLRADRDCTGTVAVFHYSNRDRRVPRADSRFAGLGAASDTTTGSGALLYARGDNRRTLLAALDSTCYEMGADMCLVPVDETGVGEWMKKNAAIPQNVVQVDKASVLVVDDAGCRWRLPKGDDAFDRPGGLGSGRVCREVCTERDLFNCHGTFYELPARNAGGFAKIRPIATHNRSVHDYCSYRGLLVMSGIVDDAPTASPHLLRSGDGRCALWVGAVDDLWQMGKPRGHGGPWQHTSARRGEASDPYLMTGYDRKSLHLAHEGGTGLAVRIEIDVSGTGVWRTWETVVVPAGAGLNRVFPDGFQAYWVRFVALDNAIVTAELTYE